MPKAKAEAATENEPGRALNTRTLLYALAALVALVGLGDALYLTAEHLSGRSAQCLVTTGCSKVLSSPYASPGGIPLSIVGAVSYFTVFSLAILACFGYRQVGRLFSIIVGLMFLTTLVLLYLQAFVIGEFCDYCLLSAMVTTALGIIALAQRFLRPRS
jgi:uncharacterized membrane protein